MHHSVQVRWGQDCSGNFEIGKSCSGKSKSRNLKLDQPQAGSRSPESGPYRKRSFALRRANYLNSQTRSE